MNLLLFEPCEKDDGGLVHLYGRRLAHLHDVHRCAVGDTLRVGEIGGATGCATVLEITENNALLRVNLDSEPPAKLRLTLVMALPRPKMLRRILRAVAELGVPELHLVNSYRVEKSYWQTPVLEADSVRDYLLQGLEQSRDTVLPAVHQHRRFKPFVEDTLPGLLSGHTGLLAHPGDHPACPRAARTPTLLVIGPEGGFIGYEVEKLQAAGCHTVSLGPRILRVENALLVLLGRLF